MRLHLAGQRQAQHATGQEPRPERHPFTSLVCAVFRPQAERRFTKRGKAPYCSQKPRRQVLCARKRTINPVSEYERLKAGQYGAQHRICQHPPPSPSPLDPPPPRHPPRKVTPRGVGALLGGVVASGRPSIGSSRFGKSNCPP